MYTVYNCKWNNDHLNYFYLLGEKLNAIKLSPLKNQFNKKRNARFFIIYKRDKLSQLHDILRSLTTSEYEFCFVKHYFIEPKYK